MKMTIHHLRHACSILSFNGKRILIDPMLAARGSYPPIPMTRNPRKNPLVDFPCDYRELLPVDGILVTHLHNDHFDRTAQRELPRDIPVLCQAEDSQQFKEWGFTHVEGIKEKTQWLDLECQRFPGTHGGGIFKRKLGCSSSYLLQSPAGPSLYITGDTLLKAKVKTRLKKFSPNIVLANGGGARIKLGGKITMNSKDILRISRMLPEAEIIAVHMESLNHCFDSRESLENIKGERKIWIPKDGEILHL